MSVSENAKLHHSLAGADIRIFVNDVADSLSRKRAIVVRSWSTIKDVKDLIQQQFHVPSSSQRLYFGTVFGKPLPNHRTLQDAGIYRSGETVLLEIHTGHQGLVSGTDSRLNSSTSILKSMTTSDVCISSSLLDLTPKSFRRIIQQARRGLAVGLKPDLVLDGSGGTYLLHDARKRPIVVFKPGDEEPYALNNPRGYVNVSSKDDLSMRAGILPGEAFLREVAAYLLDHDGFSSVPMTTVVEARHKAFNHNGSRSKLSQGGVSVGKHSLSTSPTNGNEMSLQKKIGSCQEFVNSECSMDDLSPSKLSVDQVHKIAILDIRILNADRNAANLLCRRNPDTDEYELIPIDHGYCLRSVGDASWFDWCWLNWAQMKEPLSKATTDYVLKLNIEDDVRTLKERLNIPQEGLDLFRASSKLLKAGVNAGMSLYDIAILCCRNDNNGELPSNLESMLCMANEIAKSAIQNRKWHHVAASRALSEILNIGDIKTETVLQRSSILKKSASSANFSSYADIQKPSSCNLKARFAPLPMEQCSGSESTCSEEGDILLENGECHEWAASIIDGVKSDNNDICPSPTTRRQRALSIPCELMDDSTHSSKSGGNNSQLSISPIGFWCVPPGYSDSDEDESEGENEQHDTFWSPSNSPRTLPAFDPERFNLQLRNTSVPPQSSTLCKISGLSSLLSFREETHKTNNVPSSLQNIMSSGKDCEEVKGRKKVEELDGHDSLKNMMHNAINPINTLRRSSSYSALSLERDTNCSSHCDNAHFPSAVAHNDQDYEKFRTYFHKFVDLLITRETKKHTKKLSEYEQDGLSTNRNMVNDGFIFQME